MNLGQFIESQKLESGNIQMDFRVRGKDGLVARFFKNVVCGLNWPSPDGETPGYFHILGEPAIEYGSSADLREIFLLKEKQINEVSFDVFCEALTDDCLMYSCEKVYTDTTGPFEEMMKGFWEWKNTKGCRYPNILQAPFADNFHFGVSLMRDKVKHNNLKIPRGSILHEQLSRMATVDLKEWPEKRFYAVNALRYAISGLVKYRPQPAFTFGPYRPPSGKSGGWMNS